MADSKLIPSLPIKGATATSGSQYSGFLPVLNNDGQLPAGFIPSTLNVTGLTGNLIINNNASTGANASLRVERGSSGADASLLWNESAGRWQAGLVGSESTLAFSSELNSHTADQSLHLTSAQNTLLDALSVNATELNRVAGVTSSIQTQIDSKANQATTLAGYGITDAQAANANLQAIADSSFGVSESGLDILGVADYAALRGYLELSSAAQGDAAGLVAGTIDVARLPVLPSQVVQVSSGGLADLTSPQQAAISTGTVVTTTDGNRFVYKGTGSKTDAGSYITLADISPDWSVIANRPADLISLAGASATNSLYYRPSAGTWAPVTVGSGLAFSGGALSGSPTWGSIGGTIGSQTDLNSALSAKAPLASPAFTGTPTTTTPSSSDDSTRLASTAWVKDRVEETQVRTASAYLEPLVEGSPESAVVVVDFNPWVSAGGQVDGDVINIVTEAGNIASFTLRDSPSGGTDIPTFDTAENIAYQINGYLQTNHSGSLNSTQSVGTLYLTSIGTGSTKHVQIDATRGFMGELLGEDFGTDGTPTGDTTAEIIPAPASGFKNHILNIWLAGGSGWSGNVTVRQGSYVLFQGSPDGLAGIVPFTRDANGIGGAEAITGSSTVIENTGNSTTGSPGVTVKLLYVTLPA